MTLRRRLRLGPYRIESQLASGSFATVTRAHDTVEGLRVATMSGRLPERPFAWTYPGHPRAERKRFASAVPMLQAFRKVRSKAVR